MATWFRHRCGECGHPVRNKALGDWVHADNHDRGHKVEQVTTERWED